MIVQMFKTTCENCGEEVESRVGNLSGENDIIVDFIDGMDFDCKECGTTTYIELSKFSG